MKTWQKWTVSICLTSLPMLAAAHTETLQYLGSPFTSFTANGNIANAFASTPAENTGEIVLAAPLGDNLSNASITPLSWVFNSNSQFAVYLTSQLDNSASFSFSTDGQGDLTAWNINAGGNDFGSTNTPSYSSVTLTNVGDSYSAGVAGYACAPPPGGLTPCFDVSASSSVPGTWTISPKIEAAPEFDPASGYAAVTLLLGGLAVLRGRERRRV